MVNDRDAVAKYRNRAEELRTIADAAKDPENRRALEDWAREYDEMARWAAQIKRAR